MPTIYGISMQKNKKKQELTPKEKAAMVDKTWAAKSSKRKTLTGKRAAEINFHPNTKRVAADGTIVGESTTAVVCVARMNPPSIGHEAVVNALVENNTGDFPPMLFLTTTIDKNNPLTETQKLEYAAEAFGDRVAITTVGFEGVLEMLRGLSETFSELVWVTGEDRYETYKRIIENYNGSDFEFASVRFVVLPRNEASENLSEAASATRMRDAVRAGDIEGFRKLLPENLKSKVLPIFEDVAYGLSLYDKKAKNLVEDVALKIAQYRFQK